MIGDSDVSQKKEVRENVHAYFPVLKWIMGGFAAVSIFAGTVIFNLYTDSIEMKKELETERQLNEQQDRKIEETYELMRNISAEQARIAQIMENLSNNVTIAMNRMAEDTNEIRRRVDKHIDEGD